MPNPPLPSKPALAAADINKDGRVNSADLSLLLANMNRTVSVPARRAVASPHRCADARLLPRRILLLPLSQMGLEGPTNPKGWNRDWSQKTVGAENADLFTIFAEYVFRALTLNGYNSVMHWGVSGISREKDGDSWPGVFPSELGTALTNAEMRSLFSLLQLIHRLGGRSYMYVGHAQLPWLRGELHAAAPGKNSAAKFDDETFRTQFIQAIINLGSTDWDGVALDAFAITETEQPQAAFSILARWAAAARTNSINWVEGPHPHFDPQGVLLPEHIIQGFHMYAAEIGVIDGGLDKNGVAKDITQSRDWKVLTDPARRQRINELCPCAASAVMANGSGWTQSQIDTLRAACAAYGWVEISAFVD